MKPTIKDVAKHANVSVATVSRILNSQTGYSEKTKEKVLTVIKSLGYNPNAVARGLVNQKTNTLGVLVPNISNMVINNMLNGIEDEAHKHNLSVIVCNTDNEGKRTLEYLNVLNEKRVDGIIFASSLLREEYYEYMEKMNIPVVLLSTFSYQYPLPYVKIDDKQASYQAVKYLIEQGHTKIGMISGSKDDEIVGIPRLEGYKQALINHGIPYEENLVFYGDFQFKSGVEGMFKLMDRDPTITAVFTSSDEMAMGAISAAYQKGIKVPDQLSIIGFDGTEVAEMTVPPLTTVHQPLDEMGKKATSMIMEQLKNKGSVESSILPFRLHYRESVKKLN